MTRTRICFLLPHYWGLGGLLLLAPAAFPQAAHAQTNLVQNGGFETGTFAPWTAARTGSTNLSVSTSVPHSGAYCALFSNPGTNLVSPGTSSLSQTLATAAGPDYTLTFYAKGDQDNAPRSATPLTVTWGTSGTAGYVTQTFAVPVSAYTLFTVTGLTAATAATPLTFSVDFNAPRNQAIRLDDINVGPVPAPEPSALAALFIGALGLGALTIRARRRTAAV